MILHRDCSGGKLEISQSLKGMVLCEVRWETHVM